MTEPDVDKIRRAAVFAMESAVAEGSYGAWYYAGWIKRHCEEILYEEMYQPTEDAPCPHPRLGAAGL